MNETFHILIVCASAFLIGLNLSIIYRYWPELWLTVKLVAICMLLAFVAASQWAHRLDENVTWRTWFGLAAILVDFVAVAVIWHVLSRAKAGEGTLIAYRRR